MEKDVTHYVQSCKSCQRNKSSTQRPVGLLQLLPIPDRLWSSISMDFITHLPRSQMGYDAILVFVDRLTKMTHLTPCLTSDGAPEVAQHFMTTIFRLHGLPNQIVSDRDSRFTSHFWRSLMKLLNVRLG